MNIYPSVIMPHRLFLVGAIYGYNVGRKSVTQDGDIKPIFNGHEATGEDFYLGSWLEINCHKCDRKYTFDGPNDIPDKNLVCETEGCGNHIIAYGSTNPQEWKIGFIKFT